jgi:alpha-D-ribose 1-methylphosphonate 5-triphosphate synthase subunit PhnI
MVQTHQSRMRLARRAASFGVDIGGGDALGVLMDLDHLAIVTG